MSLLVTFTQKSKDVRTREKITVDIDINADKILSVRDSYRGATIELDSARGSVRQMVLEDRQTVFERVENAELSRAMKIADRAPA